MSTTLDTIAMSRREVETLIAVEPTLRNLGLSLYCIRCHNRGNPDGVRAENDTESPVLTVVCGCAVRRHIRET